MKPEELDELERAANKALGALGDCDCPSHLIGHGAGCRYAAARKALRDAATPEVVLYLLTKINHNSRGVERRCESISPHLAIRCAREFAHGGVHESLSGHSTWTEAAK